MTFIGVPSRPLNSRVIVVTLAKSPRLLPQIRHSAVKGAFNARTCPRLCGTRRTSFLEPGLFSYFEPYLRDPSLSAILSNPRVLVASLAEVDGEHVAKNAAYLALIELLGSRTVDDWLKGTYVERFASLRKVLGLPITTTHPFVRTIDEYYAKRNCMLHRDGFIDERAKRHFNTDVRNQIGARVVANWGDYLSLHRAVHDVADRIDKYVMENHIGNAEVLRVIYRLNREHPEWLAKDVTRELFDMGLGLISRNTLAQLLKVREG